VRSIICNGVILRRGEALGVAIPPANRLCCTIGKLIESKRAEFIAPARTIALIMGWLK